jgi:virginiamycin B lyase
VDTGIVQLNQTFPASNRQAILQSSAIQIGVNNADGSTAILSPDITVDSTLNLVKTSLAASIVRQSKTMSSTIQFSVGYVPYTYYPQYYSDSNAWSDSGTFAANKRTLILVHGIFSSAQSTFPCAGAIRDAGKYNQVIGFTYDWSKPLGDMRTLFSTFMNSLPPQDSIDIEAHSYGTDVVLESLKDIKPTVGNVVLLNGPLPLNGVRQATTPGFMRSIALNFVHPSANTDPGSVDRAARSGMLSSLQSGSAEMHTLVDLVSSLQKPPRFIEVAGSKPYSWHGVDETTFLAVFFPGLLFAEPYDGVVEQLSATSADFVGKGPLPISTTLPYTHTDLPCNSNGEVQAFVAQRLLTPAPTSTPTPGPFTASVSSLTFTQVGSANSQQFTVSQSNYTGSFTLSGNNAAVATAQISVNTVTVTPVAAGSTSLTISGGGGKSVTIPISVSNTTLGPVIASVSSLTFTQVGSAAAQQFTVSQSNYSGTYTLSGNNAAVATATISGNTVTVTPVAVGSTSVTVGGAAGQAVTVPISVSLPPPPSITEYSIPNTFIDFPIGIAVGSDGALWFTLFNAAQTNGPGGGGAIGRITTNGAVSTFFSGFATNAPHPFDIAAGSDGALWFTEGATDSNFQCTATIGRITTGGLVSEYSAGQAHTPFTVCPRGIARGSDGALWFADRMGGIGRITSQGVATVYCCASGGPYGIAAGPDGAMWFTEGPMPDQTVNPPRTGGMIGRISSTGAFTEYSTGLSQDVGFGGITTGPDGALWFTESGNSVSRIGRITSGGAITEYSAGLSQGSRPEGITLGPDGALWFTEVSGNRIGRITTSGVISEYSNGMSANSLPERITAGLDGALWFTEASARIGRLK